MFFHIFYRSPCGRSLCDMQEVQEYLFETRCDFLLLEMFCMDPFVLVNRARPPSTSTSEPHICLPDISEGREVLPVPCINEVDHTLAPNISYTKDRVPAPGVSINTSPDFLIGCDCTDGCRDRYSFFESELVCENLWDLKEFSGFLYRSRSVYLQLFICDMLSFTSEDTCESSFSLWVAAPFAYLL